MLNCPCASNDCEETAPENVYRTSYAVRGYEIGRVRWDRAVDFEGGVCIREAWEEEDDEAARHYREIWQQVVVIYSNKLSVYNDQRKFLSRVHKL